MSGWLESLRDRLLCRLGYHQWRRVVGGNGDLVTHYECRNCGQLKFEWR